MSDPESLQHVERVLGALERSPEADNTPPGQAAAPGALLRGSDAGGEAYIAASWQRSLQRHRLDPAGNSYRRVLGAAELRETAARVGALMDLARPHVDALDRHVAPANYCILLADAAGVTLDFRHRGDTDARFKRAGVRPGVCWAEESEGTNGVGTAIATRQAVLVHKTDHFRVDNIALSCSAAPVFGLDDELLAVLDASTLYSPYQRESQQLVFNLVQEKALLIENAYAEYRLRDHWRLSFGPGGSAGGRGAASELLLAFDEQGRIVAANRPARRLLERLCPASQPTLAALFETGAGQLVAQAHAAPGLALPLRVCGTGELMHGVLRAPRQMAPGPGGPAASSPTSPTSPAGHSTLATGTGTGSGRAAAAAGGRGFAQLATGDTALRPLVERALRVVNRDMPIMLLGETGTGKEAFAQALHAASLRAARPFVALNCAAIPDTLIESELFGYRDGAFTGARARGARGKVLQADGGTLFLDEIGDMPLALQSRLLRVLAEGEVTPLGAEEAVAVKLSVVCATHQDLPTLVAQQRFREDLYYRLAGACFRLPPLRERTDRAELIQLLLRQEAQAANRPGLLLGEQALQQLMAHRWPGNIRQLRLALRYACAVADGSVLLPADFADDLWATAGSAGRTPGQAPAVGAPAQAAPPATTSAAPPAANPAATPATPQAAPAAPAAQVAQVAERQRIEQALRQQRWRVGEAAARLGLSRATLYRRIKALGIVAPHRLPPDDEGSGTA
ncbi:sigma-54-dependent Fis family transcriptional regulator [Aquabacterium sp. OR-4]|uniref:sigma-54-dependent Fis family transcriptional regulator n=1 Tax=Aquabacterium sp. OR-4 TaxID=2978127 RepID=UPI0028C5ACBA|nr:sigma-54-dependent Fis family transcriptional regulator [Aquabacterium sp. OR-4]MDT7838649.1 sigma-54-dependent Fis family transcriptional regulator [Aquabacterium sp. OR-4]